LLQAWRPPTEVSAVSFGRFVTPTHLFAFRARVILEIERPVDAPIVGQVNGLPLRIVEADRLRSGLLAAGEFPAKIQKQPMAGRFGGAGGSGDEEKEAGGGS